MSESSADQLEGFQPMDAQIEDARQQLEGSQPAPADSSLAGSPPTDFQPEDSQPQPQDADGELTADQLWPGDSGGLGFAARRALLQLVRGPLISADKNGELWQALLNNHELIKSRLADLFLELAVDLDAGVAFVRNAVSEDEKLPKAVKNQPLTLIDTLMLLTLRKELLMDSLNRVFVSRSELLEQLANYRPIAKLDEAAFSDRLNSSWSRLVKAGILQPIEDESRCEISPVLKLIFGVDEVKAINAEFARMLAESEQNTEAVDTEAES
jgi:hypothetical protein